MKTLRFFALAAAMLAAAGCVSSSDFERSQDQVAELQEELANVKRTASSKEEVQGVNQKIAEQTEMLLKSNATLVAKVAELEERVQNTQGSVEQASYRVDRLAQQLAEAQATIQQLQARLAGVAPATGSEATSEVTVPAPAATGNPTEIYQSAYRDYQRGNFDLAIDGFREFLAAAPNTDLSDNAAYWIGESLFSQKKYREAIEQFDSVVSRYPKSDKVPGSLLKKGYSYIAVGENAQGIVQLQYVLHEHPKSHEASLARQKLNQLGVKTE